MLANPVDFERLQADMTGLFRWMPRDFWRSSLYDCNLALIGYAREIEKQLERESYTTAAIINGMRESQAKQFKMKRATDFYTPPEEVEVTEAKADEAALYRAELAAEPQTLPMTAFTGPQPRRRLPIPGQPVPST